MATKEEEEEEEEDDDDDDDDDIDHDRAVHDDVYDCDTGYDDYDDDDVLTDFLATLLCLIVRGSYCIF